MADMTETPPGLLPDGMDVDEAFWLKAAARAIRRECGWHVCPPWTHTLRLDGHGGNTLVLPSMHVTAIASVMVDGTERAGDVDWSAHGTLVLRHGTFPDRPGTIQVTLTDGWEADEVPDVQALLLNLARRAANQQPVPVQSQSVNGSSLTFMTNGGAPAGLTLFANEKATLDPYRLTWGVRVA